MEIIKDSRENEKIKLTRGQLGKYGWEITILSIDIERLEEINKKMIYTFSDAGKEYEADDD